MPEVLPYNNYNPFGMLTPNRHGGENYRYGFQGHENDPEPKGEGNFVDFGNYGLDVHIGRRWQMDPLWNNAPYLSPYNVFGNNPISNIDPDGKFFWGLFGRFSAERKLDRAHEFASKVDGTVKLTSSGAPYVVYTTSGNGGETQIRYKNSGFGDFSSWKNFRSMMKEMEYGMQGREQQGEYEYRDGQRKFAEDLGKSSTYVKGTGVLLIVAGTATEGATIPLGEMVYQTGSTMDDVSTGLNIMVDVSEKKYKQARTRAVFFIGGKVVDKYIDNKVSDKVTNGLYKHTADKTLGAVKDEVIKSQDKQKSVK